ncbi:transglutaminase domain-containing protein [Marivirga tractuosa DSM 4126]|uniref:Transglutaminase domain-containing protein n=2 Tax=Marivirga TaxID=869806 RepID=E4TKI1_MARTH|nr:transglutaminase domain-containing protein [Marivirga tractuosa DSM 4126]
MEPYTKRTHHKICGFLILILFHVFNSQGQDLNSLTNKLKKSYPNEQAVFNKIALDLEIIMEKGKPVIKAKNYEEIIHLGAYSNQYTTNKIYTNSFETINDIEAFTEVPYKNRTKTFKVDEFKESFDKNSSVFYDDTKVLNFIFPGIQSGSKTILEYTRTLSEPRFAPGFYFQSYLPIVNATYTIEVDKQIDVEFDLRNTEGHDLKISKEESRNKIKYTYNVKNISKYKIENNTPDVKYFIPHINLRINSYDNDKNKTVNLLSGPEDLHKWYRGFIEGLKTNYSAEIDKLTNSIIKDIDDEKEQAKAIFYWVQQNIKYIAFEDGMRGFIPHNGAYVCSKRYGDCKDMASLVVNMLHHAGIEAYFTWVGTRDIPYNYSDFATPSVDNHMIATYIHDNNYYYLDATAQFSPFEIPSSMIQGKEVLISLGDNYEIKKVPEIDKQVSLITDSIRFSLKNGVLEGSGKVSLSGFARVFNNYKLDVTSEQDKEDYLKRFLSKGSNKFQLEDYNIKQLKDLDLPLLIDYSFSVQNYYQEVGDEIYLNLNLEKPFNNDQIDEDRTQSIENEYKFIQRNVNRFTIPEDYKVTYLPQDHAFEGDLFGFSINYTQKDDEVILSSEYYLDYLLMQPDQFENWNNAINKLSEAFSEIIILKK